ncbi:head maturation protease, ClpP-related [Mycolicibacterium brisbanense]|uniref:ATP-dependent Clp protease proteolytic subunit n=1 Tax=Mycolicibacterium brisbanense TaxID=146020 RepID=A0A100W6P2_9MYCO|nr:head maturation protease, ClpP-related [Mycolicibacterium brisbanense]MCV7158031.1 ATP-dependent Clp protease proteolytic subunit [Mycolicibacterium brisbanense]GAS92681.1 ATP-dependent Clp protease proteolytic subunit [Mycolicibacterium brisbanense]
MVKSWYTIKALADGETGPAEILIYDEISSWGVSAADFVRELAELDAEQITVRINSPGGAVFDGIAILNALRGHPATITTVVDSIAASIASVIAMGGDRVVMNQNSQMMIHNAWNVAVGNADELEKVAKDLRRMSANLASIYADRAGGSVDDWQARMDVETWYTADEAVAAGLADEVMSAAKNDDLLGIARASFDLSKFRFAGRDAAPAPHIEPRAQTPLSVKAEVPNGKEHNVPTLNERIVEKLGLDADADDDAIIAAFEAKVAEKPAPPAPAEPSVDQLATAAAKIGLTVVDKAKYDETVSAVAEFHTFRASQLKAEDGQLVDAAIADGKLAPANKDHWLALMEKDRDGIRATLAQLPKGLIPVAEIGYGRDTEAAAVDNDLQFAFAKITGQEIGKGN